MYLFIYLYNFLFCLDINYLVYNVIYNFFINLDRLFEFAIEIWNTKAVL